MRTARLFLDAISSTRGVILVMTGVMLGMTITTVVDYDVHNLPGRWWLVACSSVAVGCGLWAVKAGPTPTIRSWCGALWALYAAIRAVSWLLAGSWSRSLGWLPCLLLGLVVFARRDSIPYSRRRGERPT